MGADPLSSSSSNELDRIKAIVGQYFPVYETRVTPFSLILLVHVEAASLETKFDALRREMWPLFYVPQIREEHGEHLIEIVRRPPQSRWGNYVNLALLVATVVSTVFAGAFLWVAYRGGVAITGTDLLYGGIFFSAPLMLILGLHELAHFVMARHHHVDASLPYFLPVPPPILIFGTFGAFISLREPFPNRKALLDIGAAGPIVGFVVAIPITLLGLHLSNSSPALSAAFCGPTFLGFSYGNLVFGTPLIWELFSWFIPGAFSNLNPLALAGWVGILVTAFNLLPAGQLDGGHVARALLGKHSAWASWAVFAALLVMGALFYFGWFIFALFIFLVGMRHPPPLNDLSPLGAKRMAVGAIAVVLLIGGFTLIPLATPTGQFQIIDQSSSGIRPLPPGAAMADRLSFTVQDQDLIEHAYILNASVAAVTTSSNGTTLPLSGPALAEFEANSTWAVQQPNGNVSYFNDTAGFSLPRAAYSSISSGGRAEFVVTFSNSEQASVTVYLDVTQLCPIAGVGNTNSWVTTVY